MCAGAPGTEEFIHSVFAVVEGIAQHPNILDEHHAPLVSHVLPPLAALVGSSNSKCHTPLVGHVLPPLVGHVLPPLVSHVLPPLVGHVLPPLVGHVPPLDAAVVCVR